MMKGRSAVWTSAASQLRLQMPAEPEMRSAASQLRLQTQLIQQKLTRLEASQLQLQTFLVPFMKWILMMRGESLSTLILWELNQNYSVGNRCS